MDKKTITPLPDANFTPTRQPQTPLQPFRFWCQQVLPLVYDDSLSYYELLCKVVDYLNKTMEDVSNMDIDMTNMYNAYDELQSYVNDYFSNLDVQTEINNKLDEMVSDGTLYSVFAPLVTSISQPNVVDSTEEMTNVSKTYVLSSNGHIYQYKNNNWTDTGLVYATNINNYLGLQSSIPSNLNDIVTPGIYFHSSAGEAATNTPNDSLYATTGFMVISYYQNINRNYQIFMSSDYNNMYIRHVVNGNWTEWYNLTFGVDYKLASNNLNNLNQSGAFFHGSSDGLLINTPNDEVYGSIGCLVVSYYQNATRNYQMFFPYTDSNVYLRHQNSDDSWSDWVNLYNNTSFAMQGTLTVTDLNDIVESGFYYHGSSNEPVINTPDDSYYSSLGFMVISYYQNITRNYQIFMPYDENYMYIRHQLNEESWSNWVNVNSSNTNTDTNVKISKTNDTNYRIDFGKYSAIFTHNINESINADLWNISQILCETTVVIPSGTDIIGPIKEDGQDDFMGGVHGDEKTVSMLITVDGKEWDYTNEIEGNSISIVLVSEIYRVSDKTHVYNRNVKITITHNKIEVENMYTCLVNDSVIQRATNGGLIAIRNTILKAVWMNNFYSNTAPTTAQSNASKQNISGTLFWENGSVTVNNIIGHENESYSGYLTVFTNENPMRNKIYLDVISSNKQISNGENILGKFEYIFE